VSKLFNEKDCRTLEDILRLRRDVRGNFFTDDAVSDELVSRLIKAALYAPSVGYSQPWQFVVIRSDAIKQQVFQSFQQVNKAGSQEFSGGKNRDYKALKLEGILEAPVNIAIFYKPSKTPVLGQTSMKDMGRFSVVCAIQNMWLMARALNIGVGWVSIIDPKQVKKTLKADEDAELIGYLCIGYVKDFLTEPELKQKGWAEQKKVKM
jgi:5,6-dimethylbenzimidazole synthase